MLSKRTYLLVLFTTRVLAGPALFDKLHAKQAIVLVLPDGICDAKVVERQADSLTARLKDTTRLCGEHHSLVRVLRFDVRDVIDGRAMGRRDMPDQLCASKVIGVGVLAGLALEEPARSYTPGLVGLFGSIAAATVICRDHRPRYGVFVERIMPPQP